jgi:hypothetical protein
MITIKRKCSRDMVGESLNIQALQKRAIELWKQDQCSAIELGKALISLRDAMKDAHGDFAKWFRSAGLLENRVYYCIRLVEGKVERKNKLTQDPSEPLQTAVARAVRDVYRKQIRDVRNPNKQSAVLSMCAKALDALFLSLRDEEVVEDMGDNAEFCKHREEALKALEAMVSVLEFKKAESKAA